MDHPNQFAFNRLAKISLLFSFLFFFSVTSPACIVINEILINGPGGCDGSCNPDTEEWVEFYNTCGASVDLSCWVVTDGDWTFVFPSGSSIGPNGYLTIGGTNAAHPTVDINWGTCGCTNTYGSSPLGTFTNGGEQLAIFNSSGTMIDGVVWDGGQALPQASNPTTAISGCPSTNVSLPASTDPLWESLGSSGGANGCTLARQNDGSSVWEERCGAGISFGASNGALPITFGPVAAVVNAGSITYSWTTFSEENAGFFQVEVIKPSDESSQLLEAVPAIGNHNDVKNYSFDANILPDGNYWFRIRETDLDGSVYYSENVELSIHQNTPFYQVYPNPFKDVITFDGLIPDFGYDLKIMDLSGKVIATRNSASSAEQSVEVSTNDLPSGLYFYSLRQGSNTQTGKLLKR